MDTSDLDPKGYLPLLHAVAGYFRRVATSRAWRNTTRPAGCA